jgi:putative transposase
VTDLWLDCRDFCEISGLSPREVQRKVRAGEVKTRYRNQTGRNGRRVREYAASSLPPAAQVRLAAARIETGHCDAIAPIDQYSLFTATPPIAAEVRLALTKEQNEEAAKRLGIISPLLEFKRRTNGHRPVIHLGDGRTIENIRDLADYVGMQHNLSRATLMRWYSRFQKSGYTALARSARNDRGQSRFFSDWPQLAELAQSKYLAERLSIQMSHEALCRECERMRIEPPCYTTVREYLNALPKPFTIMARDGEAEFHQRVAPFLLTDFKTVKVNQIWVSDHGKHDVWVRNDCFTGLPQNAPLRPWLTVIEDMRSRKIVGAVWNATPSSHTISSALRLGIVNCGIPETFYIDNGKDYEAIGRIDFSPEASGVLVRLGIKSQYCIPKHPQSKLIESWFATVRKRFDSMWHPFYCGPSPDRRPEDCDLVLKEHAKLMKQDRARFSPLPLASDFVQMAARWIEEYNASHEHSGRGMEGRTPDEVFNELPAGERRVLDDPHALDVLFWERQKRRVLEGGCVQLYNERYEPADEQAAGQLYLQIERDILVACDPLNLGEALALDLDGHYLGRLKAQKLIARGPISRDDVKAGMRKQRLVRRVVNDYIRFISEGHSTELDHLRQRAGVPEVADLPALTDGGQVIPRKKIGAAGREPMFVEDIAAEFLKG